MGFIIHFYIIAHITLELSLGMPILLFYCLYHCFEEKEYQTESKRNETFGSMIFGTNVIQRTWSVSQEATEAPTRQEGAPPVGHAPCIVGPSGVHRRTSSSYISLRTPKTSREQTKHNFHHRNLLYTRDFILEPSPVFCRRGNRPWRASTSTSLPLR